MERKVVCYCNDVSEDEIKEAIQKGAKTLKDIQGMTKACTGNRCKELNPKGVCCSKDILVLLNTKEKPCDCCCK